jgi:predicted transposase YbfD/YdcC
VDHWVYKWLLDQSQDGVIAVDGKVVRGTRHACEKPVHLVSAFLHLAGVTAGQVKVEDKSNEIPAFRTVLEPINLQGKLVSGDAIFTQVKNANFTVDEKEGDYIFQVKQNHPGLFDNLQQFPEDAWSDKVTTSDKGCGRIEVKTLQTTEAIVGKTDFPHVAQGIRVKRRTTEITTDKVSCEVSYYIASRTADAGEWHKIIRGHWEDIGA